MCASPPQWNSVSARGPQWGQAISSIAFLEPLVRAGRRAVLVDQEAAAEAVEREGGLQRLRRILRDRVREGPAGAGCRFQAAGAQPAAKVEVLHWGPEGIGRGSSRWNTGRK